MRTNCERSKNYREKFIQAHPPDKHGKYRCVYCGKKIRKDEMQVDHVIPVSAMRRHRLLRAHLKGGVNDISNLVPSCRKCNLKKSSKTGLRYRIRARLGSHEGYWVFRRITHAILVLALAMLVCYGMKHPSQTLRLWQVCREQISSLAATLWQKIVGPRIL